MTREIKITKKITRRGDDGHKVISVRMKDELLAQLEHLSAETNRSRNELINTLIEAALMDVQIVDNDER